MSNKQQRTKEPKADEVQSEPLPPLVVRLGELEAQESREGLSGSETIEKGKLMEMRDTHPEHFHSKGAASFPDDEIDPGFDATRPDATALAIKRPGWTPRHVHEKRVRGREKLGYVVDTDQESGLEGHVVMQCPDAKVAARRAIDEEQNKINEGIIVEGKHPQIETSFVPPLKE